MPLLSRQEMFVLLEGSLHIWFVEKIASCLYKLLTEVQKQKNRRSVLILKEADFFFFFWQFAMLL